MDLFKGFKPKYHYTHKRKKEQKEKREKYVQFQTTNSMEERMHRIAVIFAIKPLNDYGLAARIYDKKRIYTQLSLYIQTSNKQSTAGQ